MIQLLNLNTGKSILMNAPGLVSTYQGKEGETGAILFHRYGDRYFFSEVWSAGGLRGHVAPSKLEREIQAGDADRMAVVSVPLAGAAQ